MNMGGAVDLQLGAPVWPPRLQLLDRSGLIGYEPVVNAFARDELLCRRVGASGETLLHLWRHPRAFVMGLRDSRLPAAGKAALWLRDLGYSTAVRNSGGAAVPLDLGVLNVSLVLPKTNAGPDFRDDFQRMAGLLAGSFASSGAAEIRYGEVAGSYCPGEFDLAIGGRKFCGIAQRRHANAIVVQAFVVVEGVGAERAALALAFYNKAAGGVEADYPRVRPETMGSLTELSGSAVTAMDAAAAIVAYVRARTVVVTPGEEELPSADDVAHTAAELEARYARPAGG